MIKKPDLKNRFGRIHNSVINDPNISHGAFRIYAVLSAANPNHTIGNKQIMKLSGIHQEKTVTKHIRELISTGLLKTTFALDSNGKPTGYRHFELFTREDTRTKAMPPTVDNPTDVNAQSVSQQGLNNIDINLINTNNTPNTAIQDRRWSIAFNNRGIVLNDTQYRSINLWISHLFKKRGDFTAEQIEANINSIMRIINDGYNIDMVIEDTIAANFAILITPLLKHKLTAGEIQPDKPPIPHQYENPEYIYPDTEDDKNKLVRKIIYWYAKGFNPKKNQNLVGARMTPAEVEIISKHLSISNRLCGSTSAHWHDYILKNEVLSYKSLLDQEPDVSLAQGVSRPINAEFSKYCK